MPVTRWGAVVAVVMAVVATAAGPAWSAAPEFAVVSTAAVSSFPALVASAAPNPAGPRYWDLYQNGAVTAMGGTTNYGDESGRSLNAPMIAIAPTADGGGYWLLGSDGGIFSFGDAHFYGSEGGRRLNRPVVGMASTADGGGYWEVASDGGIFSFGDAQFYGSTGGKPLNRPVVGMAASPDGGGYWLVASDGGVFAFGDAGFYGSEGGQALDAPIVGMAVTSDGKGYWLVASDGGVFSFGDARFYGSDPGAGVVVPASGIVANPAGGYSIILDDGQVESFLPGALQKVSLSALCVSGCANGEIEISGSQLGYQGLGLTGAYPAFDPVVSLVTDTCVSMTLQWASTDGIDGVQPTDTAYLQTVTPHASVQTATAYEGQIQTTVVTLRPGTTTISAASTVTTEGAGTVVGGTAECYTASGL